MGAPREILIEIVRIGDSMKATAIDPESGEEAVAIGPAHASREDLQRLAVGKLERRLEELAQGAPRGAPGKSGTVA
jgi:hypothetical protein